ncbi:MAG: hypothetical protein EP307_08485 [Rhodobacteraceae bacterium]|nr:MAG: hypothetical protein EP307_08485 [Paracoccaceae bacterium]
MKAIAEYFRDLAQQDRYFGAEPPQPDAEMLARIAQREIARRVEASHDGNGFVLRATDEADRPAAALERPAPAPVATATATVAAGFAPEAIAAAAVAAMTGSGASAAPETHAAPEAAAQDAVAEVAAEEAIAEDTARDMAEEIAESVEELEDAVAEADEDLAGIADEDTAADASEETDMASFFGQSQAADMGDMEEDIADEPVSQIRMPDISAPAEPQAATEDAAASARSAAADSIAAKLQRIRAVVAQSDAAQTRSDYAEDQHADVAQAPAADPIAAIMGEMGRKDADETPADAAVSARLLKVSREEFEAVLIEDGDEDDSLLSQEDEDDLMRELAEVEAELGLDEAARDEDDLYAPDEDDLLEDELVVADRKDLDEDALDALDEEDLVEEIMDLDEEGARGLEDEDEDEDEDAFEDLIARDKDDIADEEDDFASIFAEDRDDEDRTFDTDDIRDEDDMPAVAETLDAGEADDADIREGHALLDDEDLDEDLARLLAETDSQMGDAEASTRRADFDHLRAAVAAQKAEDAGEPRLIAAQPDAVYRDDLAQAVRPRRPEAPSEDRVRSRRPEDERPAPLKLVAAQRVDAEPAEVRPRRVVSRPMPEADAALADGQMSFAEFAESVGAYELPDLLEAAASYLAFVEGQDQFSRPQLMTKVRMLEPEEFSREDGLRSFGQLLRDGKIEKIQGGRFTVSDRIGFRPDDMRAAG